MKIETGSERTARLLLESESQGKIVPGRTLPKGYQWNGVDVPGRGSAPARRLRQLAAKENNVKLPDIELVSAHVHEAWMASKAAQGVTSRKSEDGEELIAPYEHLSEQAKELDRATVRAVYLAIKVAGEP